MLVLGLSAFRTDSAAAIIKDGDIIAAVREEAFSGIRNDGAFPFHAIAFCLAQAGVVLDEVESIIFFEKPLFTFERVLETHLSYAPIGLKAFRETLEKQDFRPKRTLARLLCPDKRQQKQIGKKILFCNHHLAHAGAAFFPSPFDEAAILTLDGAGEWACSSIAIGRGSFLEIQKEMPFPHSLSFLYAAFASYLGIDPDPAAAELTGLASHGNPKFVKTILQHLTDLKEDGSFRLNQDYFGYSLNKEATTPAFHALFGGPPRNKNGGLLQRHLDIAASAQKAMEHIVSKIAHAIALEYPNVPNLCLAGDMAANPGINARLLKDGHFEAVWTPPSTDNAGAALGAALCGHYLYHQKPRETFFTQDSMKGGNPGPAWSDEEIEQRLAALPVKFYTHQKESEMIALTAQALADGRRVGWFQGGVDFGRVNHGNRAVLSDTRYSLPKNFKSKGVSFRPVAISILKEKAETWLETKIHSPYAQCSAILKEDRRPAIPCAQSRDFSIRVHTVEKQEDRRLGALLREYQERTGYPFLLNDNFETGEKMLVSTPEEACHRLQKGDIGMLVIGKCILHKEEQF